MAGDLDLGAVEIKVDAAIAAIEALQKKLDDLKAKSDDTGNEGVGALNGQLGSIPIHSREAESSLGALHEQLGTITESIGSARTAFAGMFQIELLRQGFELIRGGVEVVREWVNESIEAAIAVDEHNRAVHHLGESYTAMREATNGVISAEQAANVQQRLLQAGFELSGEQLGTLVRAAREFAVATGTDLDSALSRLTMGIEAGSNRALRQFGIHLQQGESGERAMADALAQLSHRQEGAATTTRTLAENLQTLQREDREATQEVRAQMSARMGLADMEAAYLRWHTGFVRSMGGLRDDEARAQQDQMASEQVALLHQREADAQAVADRRAQQDEQAQRDQAEHGRAVAQMQDYQQHLRRMAELSQQVRHHVHGAMAEFTAERERVRALSEAMGLRGPQAQASTTGSATSAAHAQADAYMALEHHLRSIIELDQKRFDSESKITQELLAQKNAATRQDQLAESKADDEARALRQHQIEQQTIEDARSFNEQMSHMARDVPTMAQAAASATESAFNTIGQSIASNALLVMKGKESIGDALKSVAEQTLESVGTQLIGDGVKNGLMGLARGLTSYGFDPTAYGLITVGAAELAAGIAFGAAGVGVGMIGGASGGTGSGGGGANFGTHSAQGAGAPGGSGGSGGAVTYVYNIHGVMANEQTADVIRRTVDNLNMRRQLPSAMRR